ncbi:hypothetical protein MGSAQ_003286, partial [marine sediment metagenome]
GFPVVFHEADIVDHRVQADRAQAAQIQFLQVGGSTV